MYVYALTFNRPLSIAAVLAVLAVVSFPHPAVAGSESCTHPLFVGLKYAVGNGPASVAIGDLDGVNGPDLAVANFIEN